MKKWKIVKNALACNTTKTIFPSRSIPEMFQVFQSSYSSEQLTTAVSFGIVVLRVNFGSL